MIKASAAPSGLAQSGPLSCSRYEIVEWTLQSTKYHADPFNEVELDAMIVGPEGTKYCVPGFWAGGDLWRVRFGPPQVGQYALETVCSDELDAGLHGQHGTLDVVAYEGSNPLLQHGPLRMAADGRCLQHADGQPFLWLGDTWWLGLSQRFDWPDTFQTLVADRRDKGFNVIELLGGLFCDMPAHDPRGANEGGLAWEPGYTRINPAFFDWADLRIDWLAAEGLVPCILGAWSFYLQWMGVERMRQHWRYLIARYGAYPLVWCLNGGGTMPYYLSENKERDSEILCREWSQVAHYARAIDPYRRILALHPIPRPGARSGLGPDVPNEMPMRHVRNMVPGTMRQLRPGQPPIPPPCLELRGEICYPDMLLAQDHGLHRKLFWITMLSGACGYTYGLNGLWQAGSIAQPFGPSPTGHAWPNTPWQEGMSVASSQQLGWGKALLELYPWWEFQRHPEWVEPQATSDHLGRPHAAGVPGKVRMIYFPESQAGQMHICGLEPNVDYQVRFVNPRDNCEYPVGRTGRQAKWAVPQLPSDEDWLLILERIPD